MDELIRIWTDRLAIGIEVFAAVIICLASVKAIARGLVRLLAPQQARLSPEQVRMDLGRWLALGLEFLLGADILRTAAAPSWNDIGQLAAIAVLRTALNYFLGREIAQEEARAHQARD